MLMGDFSALAFHTYICIELFCENEARQRHLGIIRSQQANVRYSQFSLEDTQ